MRFLLNLASMYLGAQVERSLKEAVAPLAPYLRRLALGFVCVISSLFALSLTLLGVATGLFLKLAGLAYASAAFWTALTFFGIALAGMLVGFLLLRKPRR